MKIIGINGFKRSGKNTVYDLAQEFLPGANVQQIGFAWSLKCFGLEALGFKRPDPELILLADSIKENADLMVNYLDPEDGELRHSLHQESGREFFQNMGNLARERFGKNFWVDQVLPMKVTVKRHPDKSYWTYTHYELTKDYPGVDYLFITDVRYPNEADRIKALGGVVWEVLRPGIESDGHASEQPLPDDLIDWTINNDGSLEKLRDSVRDAVWTLN